MAEQKRDRDQEQEEEEEEEFIICIKFYADHSSIDIHHCKSSDLIQNVKAKYAAITGKPIETQRLIYGGRELLDDTTLIENRVTGNAIFQIAFKQPPPPPSQLQNLRNAYEQNINVPMRNHVVEERRNLLSNNGGYAAPLSDSVQYDRGWFSLITCLMAYTTICCVMPLIALPDIIALIIVNDYEFNYGNDKWTTRCQWVYHDRVNVSVFLNVSCLIALFLYLAFGLWLFWFLKISNLINVTGVPADRVRFEGCSSVLASTKTMNMLWWIANFALLGLAASAIALYENTMSSECQSTEIGLLLGAWGIIHICLSFCIGCPLTMSLLFDMTSNNVFAHS